MTIAVRRGMREKAKELGKTKRIEIALKLFSESLNATVKLL